MFMLTVCVLGCSVLHLLLRHPPSKPGGDDPGSEPLGTAQLSLQGQRRAQAHPREEMVCPSFFYYYFNTT